MGFTMEVYASGHSGRRHKMSVKVCVRLRLIIL
jgi:hypothetical protein